MIPTLKLFCPTWLLESGTGGLSFLNFNAPIYGRVTHESRVLETDVPGQE